MGKSSDLDVDLNELSMRQLDHLMTEVLREKLERLIKDNDPEHLLVKSLNEGFSASGDPLKPVGYPGGFVAITSSVKDVSKVKRKSVLHTVRMSEDDPGEWWTWDESCPSYVDTETVKVGNYRKTASIHMLNTHGLIIRHGISWNGEERDRTSVDGYEVIHEFADTGTHEIIDTDFRPVSGNVLRKLPPPPEGGL